MIVLSEAEELVLRAALLPAPQALPAWRSWLAAGNWRQNPMDPGSYTLLPLVSRNLSGAEAGEVIPEAGRLRGILRHSWLSNEKHLKRIDELQDKIDAAGLEVILPDGRALACRYYPLPACRPLYRQTILADSDHIQRLIELAAALGWQINSRLPLRLAAMRNLVRRAWRLADAQGLSLLIRPYSALGIKQINRDATELPDNRREHILALKPGEQIIWLCRPDPWQRSYSRLQKLVDCALIMRAGKAAIDRARLQREKACRPVLAALARISPEFQAAVQNP